MPSRTEYGRMVDFLRENTWCSPEQYKWELTVAQVRLMSYDFTHIEYLDKDKIKKSGKSVGTGAKKAVTLGNLDDLKNLSDFGIPIISKPKKPKSQNTDTNDNKG